MKNIYFKVNRRCCVLLFVIFILTSKLIFSSPVSASTLGDLFGALIPPGAQPGDFAGQTPSTPTTVPGTGTPPLPTISQGFTLPDNPPSIPAGECTDGLNRALNRLDAVQSQVIPVYQQASAESGIPWEIFAAIHYVETGGSFSPNHTLTSGTRLGEVEEGGGTTYYTLIDSARAAAQIFRGKYGTPTGQYNDFRKLVSAFAGYNGTGNRQCIGIFPKPQTNYTGCPALYDNEDHLYPLACYDERHKDMWLVYCGYRQVCPPISGSYQGIKYSPSRIGTLTLIAALHTRYQATPIPSQAAAAAPTQPPTQTMRFFNQCDSAYQSTHFGTCEKDGETLPLLCSAGCAPASVAQVVASFANASYTPNQAAQTLISSGLLSCNGSSSEGQIQILDQYSGQIEHGPKTTLNGNLASDAQALKPFFDQGWTALARVAYKRTQNTNIRGHYVWLTSIDANNDIWAYDPYFVNREIMGGNAQPPLNLNGLLRGQYPDRSFTSLDVSWYVLVRRKS